MIVSNGDKSTVIDEGDDHKENNRKGEEAGPVFSVDRVGSVSIVLGVEGKHGNEEEGQKLESSGNTVSEETLHTGKNGTGNLHSKNNGA